MIQSFLAQAAAVAAFLLLTHAFFGLSERTRSADAKLAAIGFAYCAVTAAVQLMATLSPPLSALLGVRDMSPWNPLYWLLYVARSYVLLGAAFCAWRFLRGGAAAAAAPPPGDAPG
jgi:hypothetical protein